MAGNLLILDQFGQLGGAQRCLLDLLPAFIQAGYKTHVAVPQDGPLADGARSCGAAVHTILCGEYASGEKTWLDAVRFGCDLPLQAMRIASLVSTHRIDAIYVNGPRWMPAVALGASGRPVIFHSHSLVTDRAAAQLLRRSLRSLNARVIAACQFVMQPLAPVIRPKRCRVVYNGIASVPCVRRRRGNHEPWRVGVIGRIAPEKGQLEFVQAARMVLKKQSCAFVVCGETMFSSPQYFRQVRAEAEGLPIDFMGWREDIGEVLSSLDLVVVPSSAVEATTRVILEAYSAGVPVLAFRSGGIPEIVEDGVTGVLSPPTARDLAANLLELFPCGAARLERISARAQKAFATRFSLERFRSEVLDMVQGAILQPMDRR